MLKIPYGLANYRNLIKDGYFYLDRTSYIQKLEDYSSLYPMFLRPRRFGKTLFINMLAAYYGIQYKDEFQQLFGHLYIGKNPTPLANQYLILQFDFSGIETNDVSKTYGAFLTKVKAGIERFILAYPQFVSKEQADVVLQSTSPSGVLIHFFTIFYGIQNKPQIYVLIDEYDQFTNELLSFHFHDFQNIVSKNGYVRKFYEVLKTEAGSGIIGRIFLTGVAPVTVDGMTSGYNIGSNISLNPHFHDMMGFTEAEMLDLLQKMKIPAAEIENQLPNLRNWYDGYRFDARTVRHLYNTDMVLYFAQQYMINHSYPDEMLDSNIASDYKKISNIFKIGGNESIALSHLSHLLEAGELATYITRQFNIDRGFTIGDIFSMLFYSGMTTIKSVAGNLYTFQIPNYVIKKLYFDYFTALTLGLEYGKLMNVIGESIHQLVYNGKIETFTQLMGDALRKAHSNRDKVSYGEKHLKTLMIGLLFPYESYRICSEYEIDSRYPDIFLERIPQVDIKHEVVIELKYIKKEDALKWLDNQGNIIESTVSNVAKKKGRKPKNAPNNAIQSVVNTPIAPVSVPVGAITLFDSIVEQGTKQLVGYMQSERFQRPNILGFCLIFVGNECKKIVNYHQLNA
jgi:hypothetical protein